MTTERLSLYMYSLCIPLTFLKFLVVLLKVLDPCAVSSYMVMAYCLKFIQINFLPDT